MSITSITEYGREKKLDKYLLKYYFLEQIFFIDRFRFIGYNFILSRDVFFTKVLNYVVQRDLVIG